MLKCCFGGFARIISGPCHKLQQGKKNEKKSDTDLKGSGSERRKQGRVNGPRMGLRESQQKSPVQTGEAVWKKRKREKWNEARGRWTEEERERKRGRQEDREG